MTHMPWFAYKNVIQLHSSQKQPELRNYCLFDILLSLLDQLLHNKWILVSRKYHGPSMTSIENS